MRLYNRITSFFVSIIVCTPVGRLLADNAPARTIHTIAGTGVAGSSADGAPATSAQINQPFGLARGPDGDLYFCDTENHVIRKIARDGTLHLVAGTPGKAGYGGDNGPALQAQLNEPYEVRFDRAGNLFFVEMRNNVVRRVDRASGVISTIAGTGKPGFAGDGGPAAKAMFNQPHSIQFDSHGDLYVCDIANLRIRKIDMTSGVISTFAGNGQRGTTSDGAKIDPNLPLNGPRAIDFDRHGDLWLALREGNAIYRIDMKAMTIHQIAGTGKKGFTGNGGPAKLATLSGPKGISVGPDGNVYFTDTESHSIRMIDTQRGTVELIAGTGEKGDGPEGNPLACKLTRPHGIFADADGALYIGDTENHRVQLITQR
jgi:streptogramin lyase